MVLLPEYHLPLINNHFYMGLWVMAQIRYITNNFSPILTLVAYISWKLQVLIIDSKCNMKRICLLQILRCFKLTGNTVKSLSPVSYHQIASHTCTCGDMNHLYKNSSEKQQEYNPGVRCFLWLFSGISTFPWDKSLGNILEVLLWIF